MKADVRLTRKPSASATLDTGISGDAQFDVRSVMGVVSWNGETGDVVYTPPVTSVNGQTGDVSISVPTKTSDLDNDSGYVNAGQAASSAPVQSVNGQTGNVTVSSPTKTSDLQNDSGFITSSDIPVASVNGKTGVVSLSATDVGAMASGDDISLLNNDAGYLTTETDPVFSASAASGITAEDITAWNGKQNALTFDDDPTEDSDNPVKSGGVYDALAGKQPSGNYAASHTANGAAELTVSIPYGEVDSTSTNTVFTATVDGIHELRDGVVCYIRNDVVTSTTNCTLNVNGLGAKPMYQSSADASRVAAQFTSATTWLFVYNEKRVSGGCWDMYNGAVSSNTIGYQVRTNSSTLPLTDKCYRYRLLFTSANGEKYVPANADTQTSAAKQHTTCTTPIDPFGEIKYYGTTTALSAGDTPSKTIMWQEYVVTLGYSFNSANSALTLTANKPVYITATPQSDGSAVLDYFTQTRPTTQDGKIYIFLGIADSATTVEMTMKHPVYFYDGTRCRTWNGDPADFNF